MTSIVFHKTVHTIAQSAAKLSLTKEVLGRLPGVRLSRAALNLMMSSQIALVMMLEPSDDAVRHLNDCIRVISAMDTSRIVASYESLIGSLEFLGRLCLEEVETS